MSWKMLGQIVLLIVVAVVILSAAKIMKYKMCGMNKAKRIAAMPEYSQNFNPAKAAQQ